MKTAEDHVLDIHGDNLPLNVIQKIVSHYKDYARDVAKKALKDAAENSTLVYKASGMTNLAERAKQSILNTEIILP